jgi:hypothetical protein
MQSLYANIYRIYQHCEHHDRLKPVDQRFEIVCKGRLVLAINSSYSATEVSTLACRSSAHSEPRHACVQSSIASAVAKHNDKHLRDAKAREVDVKVGETCRNNNENYTKDLRSPASRVQCSLSAT